MSATSGGRVSAKEFVLDVLSSAGVEVNGAGPASIEVHDERFFDRVMADRELGLGESYQDGWWDANQLDAVIALMVQHDLASYVRPNASLLMTAVKAKLINRQNMRRSPVNVSSHYDIGNDLYERMLDKRMIYSCGYWRDAEDLDAAQEAKLDLVCRKLAFAPGMRVLDIGCGWGGFAAYAAEKYGVEVVGISLAENQVRVASERTIELDVDIRLQDYRTLSGRFDRIVSIGMFEHVGPKNYAEYFRVCDRLLTEDGIMLLHTIGGLESKARTDPWFDKHVFPGGVLPSVAQIGAASEKRWVIEDLHNFGPDYDRTLMEWHSNLADAWVDLASYDERFRRTWEYYLLSSAAAFRVRSLQLWQIVFRRSRRVAAPYCTER